MKIYIWAIIVLGSLALIEFLYGFFRKNNTFALIDTVNNTSTAILSISLKGVTRTFEVAIYAWLVDNVSLIQLPWETPAFIIVAIILYDLCYYLRHRVSHTVNLFWAIHSVHHQSERFNFSTAFRQYSFGFLTDWIFVIPLALFGIPAKIYLIALFFDLLYQFWVHTEHLRKIPILERWFVTPSMHRVHHGVNDQYQNTNYGGVLAIWDRMFGTYREESITPTYGILPKMETSNPLLANVQIPIFLVRALARAGWRGVLSVLFGHPKDLDYCALGPVLRPRVSSTPYKLAIYAFISGLAALGFLSIFLVSYDQMTFQAKLIWAAYIWLMVFSGVGVVDGGYMAIAMCLIRPLLFFLLALGGAAMNISPELILPMLVVEVVLTATLLALAWKNRESGQAQDELKA